MIRITGNTKIVGVIGYPIKHTLSPAMHNTAIRYLGLDYVYLPFLVKPEDVKSAIKSLTALNICGINVTVPYKEKVMPYLDNLDTIAKKIGAVNTIVCTLKGICDKNRTLVGYNTDGLGFVRSLKNKFNLAGKTAILIGTGGAGKAIAVSLIENKIRKIFLTDIFVSKAKMLARKLNKMYGTKKTEFFSDIKDVIRQTDLLINATPVGMKKGDKYIIEPKLLPRNVFVYDIVYNRKTELIKLAEKKNNPCLAGLEMLLYQGVVAFELWTKKRAPVKIMRKALVSTLKAPH